MKTAYLFDENNQLVRSVFPNEFRLMTDEEKKFVKCGHCNTKSQEICYGDVEVRSRFVQSSERMTEYFVSFNHIKNCEAARISKKKVIIENYDQEGNNIDVAKLFIKFTKEIKQKGPRPVPPPGGPEQDGEEDSDDEVELIDSFEKIKTTPNLKALVKLLLKKPVRESYGGIKVFDLIIDQYTVCEHKIGSLEGNHIVLAYPDKFFYDKPNGMLRLLVRDVKNQNRVIHFLVYIKFPHLFDKLVAEQFSLKKGRLDLPIAFIGQLKNISSYTKEETYRVFINNTTAAFTFNGDLINMCHKAY